MFGKNVGTNGKNARTSWNGRLIAVVNDLCEDTVGPNGFEMPKSNSFPDESGEGASWGAKWWFNPARGEWEPIED